MRRQFFNGRYGIDNFSIVLLFISVILVNVDYLWILSLGLFCYIIFRALSKNIDKRSKELQSFNKITSRMRHYLMPLGFSIAKNIQKIYRRIIIYKTKLSQRKIYVFTKCSKCKNTLRLPRKKGKLSVTCPVCKTEFIKKT